jgi:hypothetical protein
MKTKISVVLGCCVVMVLAACLERTLGAINPCLVNGVRTKAAGSGIDKVDLLFIVDNSSSMAEEQAALRAQFPKLIQTLTTGERAGGKSFPAVKDLHLAVVSSSLLLPGALGSGCDSKGDDGLFQHQSNPTQDRSLPGCKPSYPSYLQFQAGIDDPLATAQDFACIATLGTTGCGFEHQLESGLKALWPSVELDPKTQKVLPGHTIQFVGDGHGQDVLGQGDLQNSGFLRNDANDPSLLAIVLVSDEDDCSARTTEQFASSFSDKPLNFRCQDFPDRLWPASRYVDAFKALRPGRPDLVVFAGIVGVPARLVTQAARANVSFDDIGSRNAYYDAILADPAMQVMVADAQNLRASCQSQMGGNAYPPRRIVDVARSFGEAGLVQSICQEDFAPAMDAIIDIISKRLTGVCLPRPLVSTSLGKVDCNVVWELPPPGVNVPGAPHECAERPAYLSSPAPEHAQRNRQNGAICVVKQLPVHDLKLVRAASDEGWYYDTFSDEVLRTCKQTPQRVSFTEAATPPVGVLVNLECLNEAQRYESNRTDVVTTVKQPNIGDGCGDLKDAAGNPIAPDSACAVRLADPHGGPSSDGFDRRMFCHPTRNVCVMPCSSAGDCPPAWACDGRAETVASTRSTLRAATDNSRPSGSAICVNPTCGATNTTL